MMKEGVMWMELEDGRGQTRIFVNPELLSCGGRGMKGTRK